MLTASRATQDAVAILDRAMRQLALSARAYHRVLRVARTIADLAACECVLAAARVRGDPVATTRSARRARRTRTPFRRNHDSFSRRLAARRGVSMHTRKPAPCRNATREGSRHETIRRVAMERVGVGHVRGRRGAGPDGRRSHERGGERLDVGRGAIHRPSRAAAGHQWAGTGTRDRLRPPQAATACSVWASVSQGSRPYAAAAARSHRTARRPRSASTPATACVSMASGSGSLRAPTVSRAPSTRPRSRRSLASPPMGRPAVARRGSRSSAETASSTSTARPRIRASSRWAAPRRASGR